MYRRGRRLTREEIVSAAAASFYANGYDKTTLGSVARQLDVTDKAIYHYFDSKDALYLQTLQSCTDRIAMVIETIDGEQNSGLAKLKAFASAMIRQSENLRLYIRGLPSHLEDTKEGQRIRAAERAHDETLVRWIKEGINDGSIAPGNPKMLWKWTQGSLIWLDVWSRRGTDHDGPAPLEQQAMDMLDRTLACIPSRGNHRRA